MVQISPCVNDEGEKFELSADPMLPELSKALEGIEVGKPETYTGQLKSILSNANIFGIDLYQAGIGDKIEEMFKEDDCRTWSRKSYFEKIHGLIITP